MTRLPHLLLLAGVLAAAGCRAFDDRHVLFPRLHDAIARDDDRYADRFRDRYARPPAAVAPGVGCVPCSGVGGEYPFGGTTLGTPAMGGGYATPLTYSNGPVYPSGSFTTGPVLGTPVYPSGAGAPYRPQRDDELPLPGGYSTPGAAEMGRGVAPKPPTSLPAGR